MKKNGITYHELRELLIDLGFTETMEKTRSRFIYAPTGTFLLFRFYGPKEVVSDRDLFVVRRQLVDNGLIEEAALDQFFQKVSA